jgi:hypothetical protein
MRVWLANCFAALASLPPLAPRAAALSHVPLFSLTHPIFSSTARRMVGSACSRGLGTCVGAVTLSLIKTPVEYSKKPILIKRVS